MAYLTLPPRERDAASSDRLLAVRRPGPGYDAYRLLYAGFITAPIVAGIDKYFHLLTDWNVYASSAFASLFGGNIPRMMNAVGVVEIAAGILVAVRPRLGGLVVAAWLGGIIVNLLLVPGFYDIALRDFGLMLGALALSRLSVELGR
jgi:hypothetical protein